MTAYRFPRVTRLELDFIRAQYEILENAFKVHDPDVEEMHARWKRLLKALLPPRVVLALAYLEYLPNSQFHIVWRAVKKIQVIHPKGFRGGWDFQMGRWYITHGAGQGYRRILETAGFQYMVHGDRDGEWYLRGEDEATETFLETVDKLPNC